jgi:hypothetical protein
MTTTTTVRVLTSNIGIRAIRYYVFYGQNEIGLVSCYLYLHFFFKWIQNIRTMMARMTDAIINTILSLQNYETDGSSLTRSTRVGVQE